MRRYLLLVTVALALAGIHDTDCVFNTYSCDPNRRMNELLVQSEDLRQVELEWDRPWFVDQPSHMCYERIHGGLE